MSRIQAEAAIRARVQAIPIGDHIVLSRVLGHPKMFVDTRDLGFSCHVMMDGYWEIWLTRCLARMTKPGMCVIDVGANFGYYSLLMGLAAWPGGRLISIEPNPHVFATMARTLELNGLGVGATLVCAAAGASAGERFLFVPNSEPKNATIVAQPLESEHGKTVRVPSMTIDSITATLERVDIIKIDAEGAEEDIVSGMSDTIRNFMPSIILEFNAARYSNPSQFLKNLTSIYGLPFEVNFEGELEAATEHHILDSAFGEDKLLVFSAAGNPNVRAKKKLSDIVRF